MKSKLHNDNKLKFESVFNRIKMTFNHIVEFNKKDIKKIIKMIL
jgi:hypothetical protein